MIPAPCNPARTAPRSTRNRTGKGGNRPQRDPLRGQQDADREVVQAPPAGPSRRRLGMSSVHTDLPQRAGIRLHRCTVATEHRSRAGNIGRVIVTALTPAGGMHQVAPPKRCSPEPVQVAVPPTTSPGRRGGGLLISATCVGALAVLPHTQPGGACQARKGEAPSIPAVCPRTLVLDTCRNRRSRVSPARSVFSSSQRGIRALLSGHCRRRRAPPSGAHQ